MIEPRLLNKICKWAAISVGVLCLLSLVIPLFGVVPFVFVQHLLFGGFAHLWVSVPHMVPSLSTCVGFAVLLIVSVCCLQALLDKFGKSKHGPAVHWQPKWTLSFVVLTLAAFGTACTTIGLAHHAAWLMRNDVVYFDSGRSPVTRSISNCRQLITAMRIYSSDHGGEYPKALEELVSEGVITREELARINRCTGPDGVPVPFVFLPGLSDSDSGSLPLVVSPCPVSKKWHILGMNDSSVTTVTREQFAEAMARYQQHLNPQVPE